MTEGINYGAELNWELGVDFPLWANTEVYVKTVSKGYLLEGETPKDAYWRVATTVAKRLRKPDLASKFFDYMWRGWLNLATPVFSNTGTERGLPISCFGIDVGDSIHEIGAKNLEMMLLAKHGGGVGARFLLDAAETKIGRDTTNEIQLDDITVSRSHAMISKKDGYHIRDLGSLNGTYLNAIAVRDTQVNAGDEIQIGKYHLTLFIGDK